MHHARHPLTLARHSLLRSRSPRFDENYVILGYRGIIWVVSGWGSDIDYATTKFLLGIWCLLLFAGGRQEQG